MALYPADRSPYVIYFEEGEMKVYDRDVWEKETAAGQPLFRLTREEGAAIAWFIKYWLGDHALRPTFAMQGEGVNAVFDY